MKALVYPVKTLNIRLPLILITFALVLAFMAPTSLFAQTENQAVILQYHHISSSTPAATSTSPETFRAHLEYLQANNFKILPLEEIISKLQQAQPLPDKTAAITFDDNYLTVYTQAFPLLKALNWPFTIFVSTGLVGSNAELYANWEQINEMATAGATIANHTVSHLHLLEMLPSESADQWLQRIKTEITQAEAEITENTGQSHKMLAYPYGEYNPDIQMLLNELNIIGIAQHSGPINASSDFEALPRFPLGGNYASMNSFPTKANSLAFTLKLLSPQSPITNQTMPSAQLLFSDSGYRLEQLTCYNNGERIKVSQQEGSDRLYLVETDISNQGRRFRYNCTAPGESDRYYWYSIQWINPKVPE